MTYSISPDPAPSGAQGSADPARARAFDALYRRNIDRLRRYLRGIVKSPEDAEEVAQDAFIRLYRADISGYANLEAVLFRTGSRLALNRLRARRSNPLDRADAALEWVAEQTSDGENAEDRLLRRERESACFHAISHLPPRCRQVIELRTVEQLSYFEMSNRLNIAVSTLEKHAARARRLCSSAVAAWRDDAIGLAA
jgi:RNA polymerase sigma-70 factor (ECF subfamily)